MPIKSIFILFFVILVITVITSIAFGAVAITPAQMFSAIVHFCQGQKPANIYEAVFLQIRLPRVLLCAITGAVLAVSGVLMQGLFRNFIVESGLIGTSAGAACGASLVFVLAADANIYVKEITGPLLVPLCAFAGSLVATFLVYSLAKGQQKSSTTWLLLIGVAVNAMALSITGFLSFMARDPQARSITFWNLGTFSGATWLQVFITGITALVVFMACFSYSKSLNALMLGDEEAAYLGIEINKLKRAILVLNTLMVAVATAFVGVISFVGLIVPHIMRLLIGSDNKTLLPASMLSGAVLLTIADTVARLLIAPAEIPIGIITSLVGGPAFIVLLKKSIAQKGDDFA